MINKIKLHMRGIAMLAGFLLTLGNCAFASYASDLPYKAGTVELQATVPAGFERTIVVDFYSDDRQSTTELSGDNQYQCDVMLPEGVYGVDCMIKNEYTEITYKLDVDNTLVTVSDGSMETVHIEVSDGPGVGSLDAYKGTLDKISSVDAKQSETSDQADQELNENPENEAEDETEDENTEETAASTDSMVPDFVWIAAAGILIVFFLRKQQKESLNPKFERVLFVCQILIMFATISVCAFLGYRDMQHKKQVKEAVTEVEEQTDIEEKEEDPGASTEEPEGTEIKKVADDAEEEKTEYETSQTDRVMYESTMQIGETVLTAVYEGEDTCYGVYGYEGTRYSPDYAVNAAEKEADTSEIIGNDLYTGMEVHAAFGRYYVYSGVQPYYYDKYGQLSDDDKYTLRTSDGNWSPCVTEREQKQKLEEELSAGTAILGGTAAWEQQSVICDGFLASDVSYEEQDGSYWFPLDLINGYMPYTVSVDDSAICINYPVQQARLQLGAEEGDTYVYTSNKYWKEIPQFTISDAKCAVQKDGNWWVDAETASRILGLDIKVGDGLMVISTGALDRAVTVYQAPMADSTVSMIPVEDTDLMKETGTDEEEESVEGGEAADAQ